MFYLLYLGLNLSNVDCWIGGWNITRSTEGPREKHRSGYSTGNGWKYVKRMIVIFFQLVSHVAAVEDSDSSPLSCRWPNNFLCCTVSCQMPFYTYCCWPALRPQICDACRCLFCVHISKTKQDRPIVTVERS